MAELIRGSQAAAQIKENIRQLIQKEQLSPRLGIIRVGQDSSDLAYEKGILKTCSEVGIEVRIFELPEQIGQEDFDRRFLEINEDPSIHAILLFRPLPEHLSDETACRLIDPDKDVDCMSAANWAKLVCGARDGFVPCTAESVIRICDFANTEYSGAKAVVIGRSQVIGKPVGLMLLARNATVTWCHSKTKDLALECRNADILVSACGKAKLINEEIVSGIRPDCIAIDVGVNFIDGKMYGDFDFDQVNLYAGKITPVPGGVGSVTNSVLALHVVRAAYKAVHGIDMII